MEVARWSLAPAALGMLRRSTKGRRNDCFGPGVRCASMKRRARELDDGLPMRPADAAWQVDNEMAAARSPASSA
jgi:hypothetical protein